MEAHEIVLYHKSSGFGYKVLNHGIEYRSLQPFEKIEGSYVEILKDVVKDCISQTHAKPEVLTRIPDDYKDDTSARALNPSEMNQVLMALKGK